MAKQVIGATVKLGGVVEATYRTTVMDAITDSVKRTGWKPETLAAAQGLIDVADALTPDQGDVVEVQLYSPVTDPLGTAHAAAGEVVDIKFRDSSLPPFFRAGDTAPVKPELAAARDALKAALAAE